MFVLNLIAFLASFFRPGITSVKTSPDPIIGIEQDGALIPNGALVAAMQAVQTNASPAFGNWSQTLIPAIAAATYDGGTLVGGIIRRFSPGAAFTDCTDTATNIINAIPGAKVNQTFPLIIANLGSGNETLSGGTGVTIAGTAVIASNSTRLFLGQVTGSAAVTLTNCFAWGNGLGFTGTTGL